MIYECAGSVSGGGIQKSVERMPCCLALPSLSGGDPTKDRSRLSIEQRVQLRVLECGSKCDKYGGRSSVVLRLTMSYFILSVS